MGRSWRRTRRRAGKSTGKRAPIGAQSPHLWRSAQCVKIAQTQPFLPGMQVALRRYMPYLYGDTTPFPLEENFIDTLGAVTDACVALLKVDEDLEDYAHKIEDAKNDAVASSAK